MKKTVTVVAMTFALACLFLLLSPNMLAPALAQNVTEKPDLNITAITPYHYWSKEYDMPAGDPWFNLKNYVKVVVGNNRNTAVEESFEAKLYVDDELIGSKTVDSLKGGDITNVEFEWEPKPEGEDPLSWTNTPEGAVLSYKDTSKTYRLKAFVDEEDRIEESNESNNYDLIEQKVVWNGYMADAPLENCAHGVVEGGIIYTTGDGKYRSYASGDSGTDDTYYDINYDLEIQGSTKLARLYIYYTWAKPSYKSPKIAVTLQTPSNSAHELNMEKSYNDIKGDFGGDIHSWGTYAYNITEYVKERGSYVVSVKNLNYGGGDSDFADKYSLAPPAILVIYEDTMEPKREYWINEGADLLMGGGEERPYGGFLSLEECKNTATFVGEIGLSEVEKAVLGVVSLWGGNPTSGWHSYLYFNDNELGMDVYDGYSASCSKEIGGTSMSIGSNDAQVGVELTDVTDYLEGDNNKVIQGDDGDNMMPANAFLVITYEKEEEEEEEGSEIAPNPPNITAWNPVDAVINNTEGESRTFNITVNQTVDISWRINGTEVQINESVTEAAYMNASAVFGTWNFSVIATNTSIELSDMRAWIWHVTLKPTATPTPAENITATPSPTPSPTSMPTPVSGVTPTPTSSSEEKPGAEEKTPVPGFEVVISLFMLITVAYLIRNQRKT